MELDLSSLPKGTPKIAGKEVKWEKDTEAYKLTKSATAEDLDEETTSRLTETAVTAYRAEAARLRTHRHAPVDQGRGLRHRGESEPMALQRAEFAMAAKKSGRSYTQMIGEIVDLAMARNA